MMTSRSNALPARAGRARISQLTIEPGDPTSAFLQLYEPETEQGILAALLRHPDLYIDAADVLQPGDFCLLSHGYIYHAIGQLVAAQASPDWTMVMNALRDCRAFAHVPEDEFRFQVQNLLLARVDSANLMALCRRQAGIAARLRLLRALDALRQQALDKAVSLDALADAVDRHLLETSALHNVRPSAMDAWTAVVQTQLAGDPISPAATHMTGIDRLLGGGFYPGELALLVGMAGDGKTSLLLSWLHARAAAGARDVLFSLEMSGDAILRALLSLETGIRRDVLQAGGLPAALQAQTAAALQRMAKWSLQIVDDYPALTVMQLRRRLKRLSWTRPIDLVAIDGLWLMQAEAAAGAALERWQAVHQITAQLRTLAAELHLPIVLVHQFSRLAWTASTPDLSMLADGISTARNVDVVLALWKRQAAGDRFPTRLVRLLKNRHRGGAGEVTLQYDFSTGGYAEAESDVVF